jgi:23S rRNA pseudouridine1911/1915/1917 synthase
MHSAPLAGSNTAHGTLLGWYAERCPAILIPRGKKIIEGGLLHRLDFETEGLILFAKTQQSLESLNAQQAAGQFVKEYRAITCGAFSGGRLPLPGFPPSPTKWGSTTKWGCTGAAGIPEKGSYKEPYIESFFRPWGRGRKAVRPVMEKRNNREIVSDSGAYYRTEILDCESIPPATIRGAPGLGEGRYMFKLRILRGFRHQIRCHLAWIGEPILNDTLYGGFPVAEEHFPQGGAPSAPPGVSPDTPQVAWPLAWPLAVPLAVPLALRAEAFSFYDPETREQKNYRLA